jgi:hypothetical protein
MISDQILSGIVELGVLMKIYYKTGFENPIVVSERSEIGQSWKNEKIGLKDTSVIRSRTKPQTCRLQR